MLLINQEQNINNCDLTYERFIRTSHWFQELFELQSFHCIILPVALIEKKWLYCTQIRNKPLRSRVYSPDILSYHVTDLIWLRNHDHLAKLGYAVKYLIVPLCVLREHIKFVWSSHGILARPFLVKIRAMPQPNSPDMPPKRTKKVRQGIKIITISPPPFLLPSLPTSTYLPTYLNDWLPGLLVSRLLTYRSLNHTFCSFSPCYRLLSKVALFLCKPSSTLLPCSPQ